MDSFESPNPPDKPLVQVLLEPLLNDFQNWFQEYKTLLTSSQAGCLAASQRHELVEQIEHAQQEVSTARTLLLTTDGQAGVETSMVMSWHQLVLQCWQTARQIRQSNETL
ncbi:MAG: DUF2605 domain-containing protein [Cyanobacteria bacterium P01_F01_bin.86]